MLSNETLLYFDANSSVMVTWLIHGDLAQCLFHDILVNNTSAVVYPLCSSFHTTAFHADSQYPPPPPPPHSRNKQYQSCSYVSCTTFRVFWRHAKALCEEQRWICDLLIGFSSINANWNQLLNSNGCVTKARDTLHDFSNPVRLLNATLCDMDLINLATTCV